MAPHSSTLAWKIPWTEDPGRLQSMGLLRVGHDRATSLSTFMHWRRKWQPTPVFLSGESQGWESLEGCCLWGRTELDTTEVTQQQQQDQRSPHENCSYLFSFYLTFSLSVMNFGETVTYYNLKGLFLFSSVSMQIAYVQYLWWDGWI